MTSVTFAISKDLDDDLEAAAQEKHISKNHLIQQELQTHVEKKLLHSNEEVIKNKNSTTEE